MANYNDLITAIDSVIKTNNRREITGQLLQNVLNTMVGSLGENYQLAGFATPTTNPHQPDQNVFYVASQAGVYTQFDNIVLGDGISFLMWKNGAWTSQTISMVTQSWVQQNYVSKEWFRKVFRVYDEDGLEIVPNDMDSVVDNIKAMVGLWTNEYLSALGMGRDGGGTTQTLAQLNDVQLGTLANGDALVYNTAIHKWENKQIQTGVDMSVVWAALAANTNEQINASHLATALSGYVTSANLSTMLNDYATKAWAGQNFITVEWFDKLFQLYNGTEAEANKIAPNGALPVDQTQLNIEAMFGFWTKKYISALGQGDDDSTSYTTLAQLNDVTLTNPTADQVLTYNGTHWVNRTLSLGSQTLAGLSDVAITTPSANQMLSYDATTQKWVNAAIPATGVTSVALSMPTGFSITGSPITASGAFTVTFASGYSLPTTAKQSNWDTAYGWGDHASAGYVKSSGVTSVATGTGLTGGTITTSGTISINSTYQTYISHGESAYGWGNHANAGYVTTAGAQTISGLKTFTAGLTVSGRVYGSGDDEGIVITRASTNYATICLGSASGIRSMITLTPNNKTYWRYNDGNSDYDIYHPVKNGTIALVSDLSSYVPLSGGTMTGKLQVNAPIVGYNYSQQYGTAAAFIFDKSGSNWTGIGANGEADTIYFSACGSEGAWVHNYKQIWKFNGNIKADKVQIGSIELQYDSTNNAIKVVKSDGTAASLYATGGVSALGVGQESGGGNYLPLSGGTLTNTASDILTLNCIGAGNASFILFNLSGINKADVGYSQNFAYISNNVASGARIGVNDSGTPQYWDGVGVSKNIYNLIHSGGGNFTGGLTFTKDGLLFDILRYDSDYGVDFGWRYSNKYGAGIALRSVNCTDVNQRGAFIIYAQNSSTVKNLTGKCDGTLTWDGAMYATGYNNTSDIRKKNVIKDVDLRLDQIAKAPAFEYYWFDTSIDHDLHVGTSAQYWESVLPQVVTTAKDEIGTLSMQYGVAALISAITVARKVVKHEEKIALLETRVSALEKENGEQEMLINSLQEELAKLKAA